jgi:hypothetical protein
MVSWEDFFHAITAHLGYSPSQAATDHLATVLGNASSLRPLPQEWVANLLLVPLLLWDLDPARSEMVSVIRFRDFLKGYSASSLATPIRLLTCCVSAHGVVRIQILSIF